MKVGLFPGQGIPADRVLEALPADDEFVVATSEVLGYNLSRKVESFARRGDKTLPTALAQPAIFVAATISLRTARARGEEFDFLAGHSLGEYTALVGAGALSAEDGLRAVSARGDAMQSASGSSPGGMTALLGLSSDAVEDVARRSGATVANDNAPGQVVLSGPETALAEAASLAKAAGGRARLLDVSGAFHSEAMAAAGNALAEVLDAIDIVTPEVPVISNVTARPHGSPGDIRALLLRQLTHGVRFRESLEWLWLQGVRAHTDLGPGRTVAALADKTFGAMTDAEMPANA